MSQLVLPALLAGLLALAPLAAAEYNPNKTECPPDTMCTMSGSGSTEGASGNETYAYGDEDCAHCTSGPKEDPQYGTGDCEGCVYKGGDGVGDDVVNSPSDSEAGITSDIEEDRKNAPAAGALALLAGLGAVAFAARRRA